MVYDDQSPNNYVAVAEILSPLFVGCVSSQALSSRQLGQVACLHN